MAIIRKEHMRNYTIVDNGFIRDDTLSLKAKGLMLTLLSLPDDWSFTEKWLISQSTDGTSAVNSCIKELTEHGYLTRERERKDDGTLGEMVYTVYESPITEKPILENPIQENRELLNTNNTPIYINDLPNTKYTNREEVEIQNKPDTEAESISKIVAYLNQKTRKNYKASSESTRRLIRSRLREGFEVTDFYKVIDNKVADWGNDPKYERYLRPETLFGTKFEGYLNEARPRQERRMRGFGE